MVRCARKGCGQEFDPSSNPEDGCSYHSGGPVFHEGLKSWSCCSTVNKPVLDFDEFMKLPGCTQGAHSAEAPKAEAPKPPAPSDANLRMTESTAGSETYTTKPAANPPTASASSVAGVTAPPPAPVEEVDDLEVPVPAGTKCRHAGCSVVFVSDEVNRRGDGEDTVCVHHPKPPIFHEGSKGYLCCKRRVLEFDEFMKIEGCTRGRHLFVPKSTAAPQAEAEAFTECRIDHYQTLTEIHVSIFARQTDKERSVVQIDDSQLHVDLYLPASKRFRRTLELFGPVDPSASSHKFYGSKVEVILKKSDTRSWTILEKPTRDLGNVSLTFGVTGRTGTIGAKELILDERNQTKV